MAATHPLARPNVRPLVVAGIILGVGLGGFFDGIILHLVLQWHRMVSAWTSDMTVNTFWDGIFHLAMYAFTLAGVVLVWRARKRADVPRSGRILTGAILLGAGLFNIFDSVVDHWLLGVHHIWPEGPGGLLLWDWLFFLIGGVGLSLVGYAVMRSDPAFRGTTGRARRGVPG